MEQWTEEFVLRWYTTESSAVIQDLRTLALRFKYLEMPLRFAMRDEILTRALAHMVARLKVTDNNKSRRWWQRADFRWMVEDRESNWSNDLVPCILWDDLSLFGLEDYGLEDFHSRPAVEHPSFPLGSAQTLPNTPSSQVSQCKDVRAALRVFDGSVKPNTAVGHAMVPLPIVHAIRSATPPPPSGPPIEVSAFIPSRSPTRSPTANSVSAIPSTLPPSLADVEPMDEDYESVTTNEEGNDRVVPMDGNHEEIAAIREEDERVVAMNEESEQLVPNDQGDERAVQIDEHGLVEPTTGTTEVTTSMYGLGRWVSILVPSDDDDTKFAVGGTAKHCSPDVCSLPQKLKRRIEWQESQNLVTLVTMVERFCREMDKDGSSCTRHAYLLGQKIGLRKESITLGQFRRVRHLLKVFIDALQDEK